jgi:Ras GTPase-activating-like protein IQGAP2/3
MSVMLQTPSRASTASSSSFQPVSRQNTLSSLDGSRSARQSKRYSVTALYLSMSANERDLEIEDDLAKGMIKYEVVLHHIMTNFDLAQKILRDLKAKISSQSKKNFVLEKDVRYLDSRIALLIQNRMALEEVRIKVVMLRLTCSHGYSKMKSRVISKTLLRFRRVSFPMMIRRRSTEI